MQRPLLRLKSALIIVFCFVFGPLSGYSTALAQSRSIGIVRDAEIEALVYDYAAPILQAAGLNPKNVDIILVNDKSFNAFVDGRRIFINIGALMQAETPNEIIGVIAHETGHLANGHQHRLREQLRRAQTMAVIGMLVGLGAGIAGGGSGSGAAAAGIAAGSGEFATRSLLSYQRSEEQAADRSAITYLNKTGQSAKGMLATFKRFSTALSLSGSRIDPYRTSHPLPRERIAALETLAKKSPNFNKKDPPALQERHDMMRAKIAAFSGEVGAMRRMFANNRTSLPALYGDALEASTRGRPDNALRKVEALLEKQPENPYFHELHGDILIRANRPQQAAQAYQLAQQYDKRNSSLLRISYGRALMLTEQPGNLDRALNEIKAGIDREPDFSAGYSYLAMAYARKGNMALSQLATADMHYYAGNFRDAQIFAARARQGLKPNSPDWIRAQDIINATRKSD